MLAAYKSQLQVNIAKSPTLGFAAANLAHFSFSLLYIQLLYNSAADLTKTVWRKPLEPPALSNLNLKATGGGNPPVSF
jgi:hypothetical protein